MSNLNRILGNARSNSIYGAAGEDSLDGGAGNDYLRGYGGDDILTGGSGADRFVFERTFAANGEDSITDYSSADGDVLDFSLVGFARGVFNRYQRSDIVRVIYTDGSAQVQIDVDGGGNSFQTWAVLENMELGDVVRFSVGGSMFTATVTTPPPTITSFRVSGVNELSVTADQDAISGLISFSQLALVSGPLLLEANQPTLFTLTAQPVLTTAVFRAGYENGLIAPNPDTVVYLGTDNADDFEASAAADMVFGFGGDDLIFGEDGADTIQGGAGNDTLIGGAGNDHLAGNTGADALTGGAGADIFDVSASRYDDLDVVLDFDSTVGTGDKLRLGISAWIESAPLIYAGKFGADINLVASVSSSGTTAAALLADLQALAASQPLQGAGSGRWENAGDTLIVQLTGQSIAGSNVYYVIQNQASDTTFDGASDVVVALTGTSAVPVDYANFVY